MQHAQCGNLVCSGCSMTQRPIPHHGSTEPVRVCDGCVALLDGPLAPAALDQVLRDERKNQKIK